MSLKDKNNRNTLCVLMGVVLFCLSISISSPAFSAKMQAAKSKVIIDKMAVLPAIESYKKSKVKKLEESLDCQLSGLCDLEENLSLSEETITRLLQRFLKKEFGDKVIPADQVMSVFSKFPMKRDETSRELAIRLGNELQADHVLVALIWRYEERVGSRLSAASPASVSFSLYLVNVQNNALEWQGSFDKTQKSLSDNLFDSSMLFKKGFKWLSAEELSLYGIEKTFIEFPSL